MECLGDVVDGATASLSLAQASDIIDHASQAILMRRSGLPIGDILDELDEALTVAHVIESVDDVSHSGAMGFDPKSSFDSPTQALKEILTQPSPLDSLMLVVRHNVEADEIGFTCELIQEWGNGFGYTEGYGEEESKEAERVLELVSVGRFKDAKQQKHP